MLLLAVLDVVLDGFACGGTHGARALVLPMHTFNRLLPIVFQGNRPF
jgi:hypothetical protein